MSTQVKTVVVVEEFDIVNGPDARKLIGSCFFGQEVSFSIRNRDTKRVETIRVRWIGHQAEDGSGHNHLLDFHADHCYYHGYYSSDRRKGWLEVIQKEKVQAETCAMCGTQFMVAILEEGHGFSYPHCPGCGSV